MSKYGQGRGGRPWRRIVERIKLRDQYTCQLCGRVTDEGEVDHKIPLHPMRPGDPVGTDDDANLQWLCREPCHAEKTIRERGGTVRRAIGLDGWPITRGST